MNAGGGEAKMKHWENTGQNGKWNFWYFNNLIIVKLCNRPDFCGGVGRKESERDSWMFYEDHLVDEVGKARKRCKCGWTGHSTTWC